MIIKIIKHYIILLVVFFSWVGIAHASDVVINEFVSHPNSGEQEWVELRNTTGSPINLNDWKLTELSSPGGANTTENDLLLLSGTINDVLVFEVGTSKLNDSGDSIGLYNVGQEIDRVTYGTNSTVKNYSINLTAPSIGKSGTLVSTGNWATNQEPSKNLSNPNSDVDNTENPVDNTDDTTDTTSTNATSSTSTSSTTTEVPVIFKITTKIISPKIVTAGIPFSLSSLTTTNRGETYAVGRFVWNFGDGMIREVGQSNPFEYMYEYSGEYALTISYYGSVFSINPDAVDRITIKVVPSGINISSVGTINDPFVEIENKSSYEIILSNWIVTAGTHYFVIPEGTTLLPNKKIKLSPKITGFVGEDIKSVIITNPNKEIIATYPTEIKKPIQKISSVNKIANINPVPTNNPQDDSLLKDSQVINLNDLGANAQTTGVNIPNSTYPIIGLLVIIGLGIASFLLIRKKRDVEDYVEKGIRAEDMTIIE